MWNKSHQHNTHSLYCSFHLLHCLYSSDRNFDTFPNLPILFLNKRLNQNWTKTNLVMHITSLRSIHRENVPHDCHELLSWYLQYVNIQESHISPYFLSILCAKKQTPNIKNMLFIKIKLQENNFILNLKNCLLILITFWLRNSGKEYAFSKECSEHPATH